jgi:hypothetical protein
MADSKKTTDWLYIYFPHPCLSEFYLAPKKALVIQKSALRIDPNFWAKPWEATYLAS